MLNVKHALDDYILRRSCAEIHVAIANLKSIGFDKKTLIEAISQEVVREYGEEDAM